MIIAEQATNGWDALISLGSIALLVSFLLALFYLFTR